MRLLHIDFGGSHRLGPGLEEFGSQLIAQLKQQRRWRCAETYRSALNSFGRYCGHADFRLSTLNSDTLLDYQDWLQRQGIGRNTSSFYMRNLRAIYNQAVSRGLINDTQPFKHVYTGIGTTVKRALGVEHLRQIANCDLSAAPEAAFARDMFILSYCLRGISFVDMAHLRRDSITGDTLTYTRQKTKQHLAVEWDSAMQTIVQRHQAPESNYLLPILDDNCATDQDRRRHYRRIAAMINRKLKQLGRRLNLPIPLTMYVARHSWASAAYSQGLPISIISQGMGHTTESTTRIYLSQLDQTPLNQANRQLISLLSQQ